MLARKTVEVPSVAAIEAALTGRLQTALRASCVGVSDLVCRRRVFAVADRCRFIARWRLSL